MEGSGSDPLFTIRQRQKATFTSKIHLRIEIRIWQRRHCRCIGRPVLKSIRPYQTTISTPTATYCCVGPVQQIAVRFQKPRNQKRTVKLTYGPQRPLRSDLETNIHEKKQLYVKRRICSLKRRLRYIFWLSDSFID